MSKGYKNTQLAQLVEDVSRTEEVIWTNSRGITVRLLPIPPYLVQLASSSIERPTPPTYTVKLEGGGTETHIHDETSIAQSSEEEKKLWEDYKLAEMQADQAVSDLILDIVLMEGVVLEPETLEASKKRLQLYRVSLPEDPEEAELFMRRTFLIGNRNDAEAIVSVAMALTGASPERLKVMRKSFPDPMDSES